MEHKAVIGWKKSGGKREKNQYWINLNKNCGLFEPQSIQLIISTCIGCEATGGFWGVLYFRW